MIPLNSADRLLILAPHPDDESLATGGLIQRALAVGARLRVLFVTSGDNNPWPQRFLERRWRISLPLRERWAERRRAEANAALRRLGADAAVAHYLAYPDQGLTDLLMSGDETRLETLREEWRRFRPTVVVLPSVDDAHPDHSALGVIAGLVLNDGTDPDLRSYDYVVHHSKVPSSGGELRVPLSDAQQRAKLAAIRCHESQTALSRGRLEQFARPEESFRELHAGREEEALHPIASVALERDLLTVAFSRQWHLWGARFLLLAGEDSLGRSIRWSMKVSGLRGKTVVREGRTSIPTPSATVETEGKQTLVRIRMGDFGPGCHLYAKLSEPTMFFDRSGWREILTPARPGATQPGPLAYSRQAQP